MNFNNTLFSIIILLYSLKNSAQNQILNTIEPIDSMKAWNLDQINKEYEKIVSSESGEIIGDKDLGVQIAHTYIWRAKLQDDSLQIGRGFFLIAKLKNYSHVYLDLSIEFTNDHSNLMYPSIPLFWKFQKYYTDGDYKLANLQLMKANEIVSKVENHFLKPDTNRYLNFLNADWGDKVKGLSGLIKDEVYLNSSDFLKLQNTGYTDYDKRELYLNTIYHISKTYYSMGDLSKASEYLDSVKEYGLKYNILDAIDYFNGLKGAIYLKLGEYENALQYTNAYLNNNIQNKDFGVCSSSVIKGLSLWGLGEKELAVASLIKADSIYQLTQDEFEELGDGYKTLIAYYKKQGDKDKQLEYLNKLLLFDEEITSNYLEIAPAITRSYTIPELLSEKEAIIQELSASNQINKHKKTIYYILLMIASVLISYFVIQRVLLKRRFDKIKEKLERSENQKKTKSNGRQELFELDAKQIERIAKGLERFELEKGYIDTRLSLKSLANYMDSNSSYLSKYINAVKGVNFSHYVNTLRINDIIQVLQVNAKMRAYTIDAIAEEAGFSNTRSFSNHFKRVTGINPSYFLKQLQKEDATSEAPAPQTV